MKIFHGLIVVVAASVTGACFSADDGGVADSQGTGSEDEIGSETESTGTDTTETTGTTETETETADETDETSTTGGPMGEPGEVSWSFEWGAGFPTMSTASSTGEILLTGSFFEPLELSTGTLTPMDSSDIVVMGLSSEGELGWAARAGGAGAEYVTASVISPNDRVIVGVIYEGTPDFGSGPLPEPGGGFNGVLLGFDGPGIQMEVALTAPNIQLRSVDVNGGGFVIAGGSFNDALSVLGSDTASAGGSDGFYTRINTQELTLSNLTGFGGNGDDGVAQVLYDGLGGVYILGQFAGMATFGVQDMVATGSSDVFVIRADTSGTVSWVKQLGGPGTVQIWAAAVGDAGELLVTGNFDLDLDFEGEAIGSSAGGSDAYVLSLSSAGALNWAQLMPGLGDTVPRHLVIADDGVVSVGGDVVGPVDLGAGEGWLDGEGELEGFVVRYTPEGEFMWGELLSSAADDRVNSLGHDHEGRLLVGVSYLGDLSLSNDTVLAGAETWRSALISIW